MKKYCFLLLIASGLLPLCSHAQEQPDITGMWYGELVMTDTAGNPVHLPYEIAVSEEKGKLLGYSRIVFHANGKEEAGIQDITLKMKGNTITMEDEGFIEHQFSINPSRRVKKTMVVKLETTDKEMIMDGTWSTNRTRYYLPAKGTVVLRRKLDFRKSELFKSLDTLKLVQKLSFKDRPDEAPVVVAAAPKPEPTPEPVPEPEPVFNLAAIDKTTASHLPVTKKPQPAPVGSMRLIRFQLGTLAKTSIKPAPKPEPVVAAAPKPEKKPVVTDEPEVKPKAVPEKKPEPVIVQAPPKPAPVPQPVIAPSVIQGAAEINKRVTKNEQSFFFESDSLLLTLYDNGEVDGDTVTVLMNGNVIFSKVGLDVKPNSKTVYITPNMDSVKLVMYAESLGEIPPNTGLLIVNDGSKRYEIRFSADLKTNAAIIFRRKKDE